MTKTASMWILSCFLALSFLACKLNPPGNDVDFEVPSEFNVELFERLDSSTGTPDLGLIFKSVKTFPCKNTQLKSSVVWSPAGARVLIEEILEPTDCIVGDAPVVQFVSLGQPVQGRHQVEIVLGDVVVNTAVLTVSDREVSIEIGEQSGITVLKKKLFRMPKTAIWGVIGFGVAADEPQAKAFLDELFALTGQADFASGNYGYFALWSPTDYQVIAQTALPMAYRSSFVRQSDEPKGKFLNLVQQYRNDPQRPLAIEFWTTKGRI